MKIIKRLSLLALSGIMALSLGACSSKDPQEEQKKFDRFIEKQFIQQMESDYTTMHVYLKQPQKHGVDPTKVKVNLGERPTIENQHKAAEKAKKVWDEFKEFKRDILSDEQKQTYDCFEYQGNIELQLMDKKFDYYQQMFASISGIHYQMPTLFSDWDLRNEQDVKDLILLVKDVKPYVDCVIQYTKEQADKGLLMTNLDDVKKYCDGILKKGENSAILTSMYQNIDTVKLSKTKAESYKKQLKQAFTTSFLPAYQDISDLMKDLKKSSKNNDIGLAKFENGKAYYALLLQKSIGSNKSVDDIKKMMNTSFNTHLQNLQGIVINNLDIVKKITENKLPVTSFKSYDEILSYIKTQIPNDFPSVKELKYNIKAINDEIASSSGVAAYFNIPPLDGDGTKQLRVNPKTGAINKIQTYSTVAHEGFPGHMFQYSFMYENQQNLFRNACIDSSAYVEGYAVYAQYYAYNYLKDIDQNLLLALKENELASYNMIILADIGIHYEGWSLKDFKDHFNAIGFQLSDHDAMVQYSQLQANPCAFEPYYVGYEEIASLKEKAVKKLGDAFDDKAFHTALLKSGVAPFNVVEENINAYIEKGK